MRDCTRYFKRKEKESKKKKKEKLEIYFASVIKVRLQLAKYIISNEKQLYLEKLNPVPLKCENYKIGRDLLKHLP